MMRLMSFTFLCVRRGARNPRCGAGRAKTAARRRSTPRRLHAWRV